MRKLVCVLVCFALICCGCAACAETVSAYAKQSVNVYQSADTASKLLGKLSKNKVVSVLAVKGDWCKVRNGKGEIGYCKVGGLQKIWKGSAKGYVTADKLPIYSSNSTSSERIGFVEYGDVLTVVAAGGGWCQVKNRNGKLGFCEEKGLSKTNPIKDTCWISYGGKVAIYAVTQDMEQIATVTFGQKLTLLNADGTLSQVKNSKGVMGYVSTDAISTENPCNMRKAVYTQTAGYLLYTYGSGKVASISLAKNTPLTLLAVPTNGTWCIVEYKGTKYYVMHESLLSTSKATEATRYTLRSNADLYEINSHSGQVVCTLKKGDKVDLLEYTRSGSCKVQMQDGTIGYLMGWSFR